MRGQRVDDRARGLGAEHSRHPNFAVRPGDADLYELCTGSAGAHVRALLPAPDRRLAAIELLHRLRAEPVRDVLGIELNRAVGDALGGGSSGSAALFGPTNWPSAKRGGGLARKRAFAGVHRSFDDAVTYFITGCPPTRSIKRDAVDAIIDGHAAPARPKPTSQSQSRSDPGVGGRETQPKRSAT